MPEHLRDSLVPSEEVCEYLEIQLTQDEQKYLAPAQPSQADKQNSILQEPSDYIQEGKGSAYQNADEDEPVDQTGYQTIQKEKIVGLSLEQYSSGEESEKSHEEATIVETGNQLYNSFVGVKKLPAGKVTIEKYLAEGAFGQVYCGQWDDKRVALKQINLAHARKNLYGTSYKRLYKGSYQEIPIGYEAIKEAMQWEVARLSTANHPNLVQFYGLYQDGNEGDTYMVMEFCEGGTMQGALKKENVPWSQRWQWALQISEALAYLHQEGVLHRDLKAENILLDKNGKAKLADLGVAQVDALLQDQEARY